MSGERSEVTGSHDIYTVDYRNDNLTKKEKPIAERNVHESSDSYR